MRKFLKKIKNKLKQIYINKKIANVKYVHLMFNDKFNKSFVDFLNRNFEKNEHLVLCKRYFKEFAFPDGKNVIEIKSLKGLDFSKVGKVICHSLFDEELVDYLYKKQDILKQKTYWCIWGGDLYNAQRGKEKDFVRKNFKGYLLFADKDKNVLLKNYKNINNKNFFSIEYPLNVDISVIKPTSGVTTVIQINNSCDFTTLEMLDILSKYKDKDIKIMTILSYGQLQYKDQIIKKGKEIFGSKFNYIEDFISPLDYAKYLASIDIFVANQNRQQATANIDMCLYFDKKVFIKSDVSTFDMYTLLGYKIFDTYSIKNNSFEEFSSKVSSSNSEKAKYYTSDLYRKKLWEQVLND